MKLAFGPLQDINTADDWWQRNASYLNYHDNQLTILTVSQLNRHVRTYLEYEMGEVCVAGEISN